MRIAILSDIHDNLTALEAVARDIKRQTADLVLHVGDLVGMGSSPRQVVDFIRAEGWQGVMGNNEEMMVDPESFESFIESRNPTSSMWSAVRENAAWCREQLGENRLKWLETLPRTLWINGYSLVHASPESTWICPPADAGDQRFEACYQPFGATMVVFGHLHIPLIKHLREFTLVNCGSVGSPQDGDTRASYAVLDDGEPQIIRVQYDLEYELDRLSASGLPHAKWTKSILERATYVSP